MRRLQTVAAFFFFFFPPPIVGITSITYLKSVTADVGVTEVFEKSSHQKALLCRQILSNRAGHFHHFKAEVVACLACIFIAEKAWMPETKTFAGDLCKKKKKKKQDVAQVLLVQEIELIIFYFIFSWSYANFLKHCHHTLLCHQLSLPYHSKFFFFFSRHQRNQHGFCHGLCQPICVSSFILFIYFAHEWSFGKKKLCHV